MGSRRLYPARSRWLVHRVARFLDANGLMKRVAPNNVVKMKPKKKAQERAAAKEKAAAAKATEAPAA